MEDADQREGRSLPDLVAQLTGDLASLVRKESELIRAEIAEKLHAATRAVADIAAGGLLLIAALMVLLQALVLALSNFMAPTFAALLVGLGVAIAGYLLVRTGMKLLNPMNLTPDRSARQLKKDAELVKDLPK